MVHCRNMIQIYTDGGNSAKNKVGGWAAVFVQNDKKLLELSEGYDNSPTNNHMEMGAVIGALSYVLDHPELGRAVTIVSDSEYVVKGASEWLEGWKRKNWKSTTGPVKNKVLWEAIDALKGQLDITWTWVRGHDGNKWNERADKLCVKAYKDLLDKKTT